MHRSPLADQMPYRFYPPRVNRFLVWASRPIILRKMRREQCVEEVEITGQVHLEPLLGRGDGVLLTPNHADHPDAGVLFELGARLRRPFCYLAAYQIFKGVYRWVLPRLGVFPIDREGADLTAFKTAVDVLVRARHPLVVFPEGEIYRMSDRLTPLRDGAVAIATAAARRLADSGRTVWIVPAAIKYRFRDDPGRDPLPWLLDLMGRLEARFTWWSCVEEPLVERIYRFAEGMLALKELEYLGAAQSGPLRDRLATLRDHILDDIETRRLGKPHDGAVPVRVKELRRACLELLADPGTTPEEIRLIRKDLNSLFVVIQMFSYPGNYVRECPTYERAAEILLKFEEDVLGVEQSAPRAPRRAILRLGEPIDVRERLAAAARPRAAVAAVTAELEARIQALLDAIGPGRLMASPPAAVGVLQNSSPSA